MQQKKNHAVRRWIATAALVAATSLISYFSGAHSERAQHARQEALFEQQVNAGNYQNIMHIDENYTLATKNGKPCILDCTGNEKIMAGAFDDIRAVDNGYCCIDSIFIGPDIAGVYTYSLDKNLRTQKIMYQSPFDSVPHQVTELY